jgi:hypothetical protein
MEPAGMSLTLIQVADLSGAADARAGTGTALKIKWARDVSWSKTFNSF